MDQPMQMSSSSSMPHMQQVAPISIASNILLLQLHHHHSPSHQQQSPSNQVPQQLQSVAHLPLQDRLARLDQCERRIVDALDEVAVFLSDCAKDKVSSKSIMEGHVSKFRESVTWVEGELNAQIDYLSNVTVTAPHQGSAFLSEHARQLAIQRAQHIDAQVGEWWTATKNALDASTDTQNGEVCNMDTV